MPLTMEDYNVLGSVIDSSFANSSANQKGYYVKVKFAGTKSDSRNETQINPMLEIYFSHVVNFNPRHGMDRQKKELDKVSMQMLNSKLTEVKKEYRDQGGKTLATKLFKEVDYPMEHISHNPSLVRAVYKKSILVEIT